MSKTLTVYLAADVSKLTNGLRTAKGDVNQFDQGIGGLGGSLSGMLGPALIGAAAAASAFAISLGVDAVKAAMEDEKSVATLTQTLGNLGLAHNTSGVMAFVDALSLESGVADDKLRPSLDRLVRSTGDVTKAQELLQLSLNISAGTGKDLESVSNSLARGFDGSTTALGKLGAGLSSTLLATGDMTKITAALAQTFAGQAATAADTYQGKLDRLTISVNEAKEKIGYALVGAMDDLSDSMGGVGGVQAQIDATATEVSTLITGIGGLILRARELAGVQGEGATAQALMTREQQKGILAGLDSVSGYSLLVNYIMNYGDELIAAKEKQNGFNEEMNQGRLNALGLNDALNAAARATFYAGQRAAEAAASMASIQYNYISTAVHNLGIDWTKTGFQGVQNANALKAAQVSLGGSSTTLKDENDKLTETYDKQADAVKAVTQTMTDQVKAVEKANQAVTDYQQSISDSIMGAIQLGDVQKMGKDIGVTTLDAFQMQIDQAAWFGNVLQSIKASGADQLLIDQLASLGPGAGGALAQEMIDKGLVQTFSDKLVDVVAAANTVAQSMVPEFLVAGQDAANATLNGMIEKVIAKTDKLQKLGSSMGSTIGDNMKTEILKSVAEALKAAEDARNAAAAAQAARQAANQANSDQQIAQALQRLITNSNARGGYMDVSTGAGVLG